MKEQKREAKAPILEAFRHSTPEILLSAGSRFVEQAPFYLFATFAITYGGTKALHLDKNLLLNTIAIAAVLEMFTILLFGYLSDRFGRRLWYLIDSGSSALVVLAIILSLAVFHAWVYGPQAAMIAERFKTSSRYSGASLGYQLAAPLAGGLAPIIALLLLNGKTNLGALGLTNVVVNIGGGSWTSVAVYIMILAVISFASVLGLKDLTNTDISEAEADEVKVGEAALAD